MTPVKLTMKYHLCNFTTFLILFFSGLKAGDQTNIAVIDSLSGEIIRENLQRTSIGTGDTVALQIDLEDTLVPLATPYRQDLWQRVQPLIEKRLAKFPRQSTLRRHRKIQRKLAHFLDRDLKKLFDKYQHDSGD